LTIGGRLRREAGGVLLLLEDDRGFAGLGEITLLFGWPGGDRRTFQRQLLALERDLPGTPRPDATGPWDDPAFRLPGLEGIDPMIRAALEQALLCLVAESRSDTPLRFLATRPENPPAERVPVAALLEGTGEEPVETALRLAGEGFGTFKLKVGRGDARIDVDRVRRLREALGPGAALRLDANRAWDLGAALSFCREVAPLGIEFIEEPVGDPNDLIELGLAAGIPLALDESLVGRDPASFSPPAGVTHLVLKPAFLGGASATMAWIRRARSLGLTPVISSVFQSAVGWSLDALLAASLGPGAAAAGIGTHRFRPVDLAALAPDRGAFPTGEIPWRRIDFALGERAWPTALDGSRRWGDRAFFLSATAERIPGSVALDAPGREVSYGELDALVLGSAWAFLSEDLLPGDRVAFRMASSFETVVLLLACWRAGLTAVLLDPRLPPAGVAARLAQVPCRMLVTADNDALPADGALPTVRHPADLLVRPGSSAPMRPPATDAPATVVFTSGSLGIPKGALHSLANHLASAAGFLEAFPMAPGDRWLLALPLHHVGGLAVIFRSLLSGAAVVIPEGGMGLVESVSCGGITHLSLVGTQLARLLREQRDLAGAKLLLLGGSAIPAALVEEAAGRGWPVATSYGLTEMSSTVAAMRPGDPPGPPGTAGRALPGRRLSISAEGEILVSGPMLFGGYLAGGEVVLDLAPGGWFATGDVGAIDPGGKLVVHGRRDTMFISGGENIHPESIERELAALPGVAEAVVVPVDDAEFGARPVAFVRMADDSAPDTEGLRAALRLRLPSFMVPVRVLTMPARNALKPDRAHLAALASRP
jgi:O-succinylbenzoic acid--CoA ligase